MKCAWGTRRNRGAVWYRSTLRRKSSDDVAGIVGAWAGAARAGAAWALVPNSGADSEIRGLERAVAAMPRW